MKKAMKTLEYNQLSLASEILKKSANTSFSENFKVLLEVCQLKLSAYLGVEILCKTEALLLEYQYSRLSLKYNLKSPLHKVFQCINRSCLYSQLYSISVCQFPMNF